jgi:hypothetical protein
VLAVAATVRRRRRGRQGEHNGRCGSGAGHTQGPSHPLGGRLASPSYSNGGRPSQLRCLTTSWFEITQVGVAPTAVSWASAPSTRPGTVPLSTHSIRSKLQALCHSPGVKVSGKALGTVCPGLCHTRRCRPTHRPRRANRGSSRGQAPRSSCGCSHRGIGNPCPRGRRGPPVQVPWTMPGDHEALSCPITLNAASAAFRTWSAQAMGASSDLW